MNITNALAVSIQAVSPRCRAAVTLLPPESSSTSFLIAGMSAALFSRALTFSPIALLSAPVTASDLPFDSAVAFTTSSSFSAVFLASASVLVCLACKSASVFFRSSTSLGSTIRRGGGMSCPLFGFCAGAELIGKTAQARKRSALATDRRVNISSPLGSQTGRMLAQRRQGETRRQRRRHRVRDCIASAARTTIIHFSLTC